MPKPGETATEGTNVYRPVSMSPDGAHMLIDVGYYPGEYTVGLLNVSDDRIINIEGNEVPPCCSPTWSADGQSLLMANPSFGMFSTGLWRIDAQTGQAVRLIGAPREVSTSQLVGHAYPAADGKVYYFYGEIENSGVMMVPSLQMRVAHANAFAQPTALRTDTLSVAEALWSHETTPTGAVIVDGSQAKQYPFAGPLRYLKIDGSPALTLTEKPARLLHWGK